VSDGGAKKGGKRRGWVCLRSTNSALKNKKEFRRLSSGELFEVNNRFDQLVIQQGFARVGGSVRGRRFLKGGNKEREGGVNWQGDGIIPSASSRGAVKLRGAGQEKQTKL